MKVNNHTVNIQNSCYIIAEISHNHQSDEEEVLKIIEAAAECGASAVKFQKRNNQTLFFPSFYNKPYENNNSFGKTYGEHREFLEPKLSWLKKANKLAHLLGLDFIMTVFDLESLALCEIELNIDAYKIQSADLTSHYLIEKVAATGKPYFISCGASTLAEIQESFDFCMNLKTEFCLMYAVSQYPTSDEKVHLNRITQLKKILKTEQIGFSCHHVSIDPSIIARSLGAVAIEKHFTLDKAQKGPDHKLSITPLELIELRKRLQSIDLWMGETFTESKTVEDYQLDARFKMGKSAEVLKDMLPGEVLSEEHLAFKSPMLGKNPLEVKKLIGKTLESALKKGEIL